jgi:hypothetical protein
MLIVEKTTNSLGQRLITFEIPQGTNLFKAEPSILPLFNGWAGCLGDTLLRSVQKELGLARKAEESSSSYFQRLQKDYLWNLNKWFLTVRSRNWEEDSQIALQMDFLNSMDKGAFLELCQNAHPKFPKMPHLNQLTLISRILKRVERDPFQAQEDAILLHYSPLDGFGVIVDIGDISISLGYKSRQYLWFHAFYDDELMINDKFYESWEKLTRNTFA